MDALKESISKLGILVPLVVYESGAPGSYTLLDGERRLKCAKQLGLRSVPVNITTEPSETENILLMFNIHSLREQWDPYTIALALDRLMKQLDTRSSRELSALTGFSVGSINRSKKLLRLPQRFLDSLRIELGKPKSQQRLTEDFFLELSDAVSAIKKYQPSLIKRVGEDVLMDEFVRRRERGELENIVDLRVVADVANYARSGISQEKSIALLDRIVESSSERLDEVYAEIVEHNKHARGVIAQVQRLTQALSDVDVTALNSSTAAQLHDALGELAAAVKLLRTRVSER